MSTSVSTPVSALLSQQHLTPLSTTTTGQHILPFYNTHLTLLLVSISFTTHTCKVLALFPYSRSYYTHTDTHTHTSTHTHTCH